MSTYTTSRADRPKSTVNLTRVQVEAGEESAAGELATVQPSHVRAANAPRVADSLLAGERRAIAEAEAREP